MLSELGFLFFDRCLIDRSYVLLSNKVYMEVFLSFLDSMVN